MTAAFETVDEYNASFPPDVQPVLQAVREAIHSSVPGAEEKIRYGIRRLSTAQRAGARAMVARMEE